MSSKSNKAAVVDTISTWARPVADSVHEKVDHPQTAGGWACWHVGGPAEPTAEQRAEMEAAKDRSKQYAKDRAESFERCDTDGFLTQWADGISSHKEQIASTILSHGGLDFFPGLYTMDGQRVRARMRDGEFGTYWQCEDEHGRATGVFFPDSRGPNTRLAKAGLIVVAEWVPAEACVRSVGHGLSGHAWAASKRLDRGYPENAPVILRK